MPGTPSPRRWLFLGLLIDVLTEPGAPVTVAEAIVPEGASPLARLHAALDGSFLAAVREIGRPGASSANWPERLSQEPAGTGIERTALLRAGRARQHSPRSGPSESEHELPTLSLSCS